MRFIALFIALVGALLAGGSLSARQAMPAIDLSKIDAIFSRWTTATPGCAVGASVNGKLVVNKAYGMADLEHDVPNTAETIFEAGSVSKQFTAAGVLLLAREGKLSLDDPVRKYVPELPDYGSPILIRHMLTHMSGLRDWGSVMAIAGWPRTSRVYTHAHVLDIVSRQSMPNFPAGTQYSYSNTGYNLAAIIIARVTGKPFAEFEQERLFKPLGMTHTSWRDDFTRVVKGRAIAYEARPDGFHQDMPFENIHGNGGLLTTVGDLLKWNQHFTTPGIIGDTSFVKAQETVGIFNNNQPGTYAMGLVVGTYRGVKQIDHSGSTAGYRAHLARYPDQGLSVAVLCNVSTGAATQYAHDVVDAVIPSALGPAPARPAPAPATPAAPAAPRDFAAYPGTYVSDDAETTLIAAIEGNGLVLKRRPDTVIRLTPAGANPDVFTSSLGQISFRRDAPNGKIIGLSVRQDRVWNLLFERR